MTVNESEVYELHIDLSSPVAAADPYIHLDSFVSYAAGVEAIGHEGLSELDEGSAPRFFETEMPFKKYERNGEWVWGVSAGFTTDPGGSEAGDGEGVAVGDEINELSRWSTTKWRKHFDDDAVHQAKETHVDISTGEFKSYNSSLPYAAADELTFLFELRSAASPERVVELIDRHVSGIGKKRSQGFGQINTVEYRTPSSSFDSAIYHDGVILRSLPGGFGGGAIPDSGVERRTVRPPYWHAENQDLAFPPFAEYPREEIRLSLGRDGSSSVVEASTDSESSGSTSGGGERDSDGNEMNRTLDEFTVNEKMNEQ